MTFRRTILAGAFLLAGAALFADDLDKGIKTIRAADLQRHTRYLSSDDLQGREAGSEGGHKAAVYIGELLAKWNFEGGGDDGTWFQTFGQKGASGDLAGANALRLFKDKSMKANELFGLNEGFVPLRSCRTGSSTGEVVFAGYGITAPEYDYDDYRDLKAKDAIVLILDHEPQEKDAASRWEGDRPTKYSAWEHKIENAQKNGAAALLIALDPANHAERGVPESEELRWPGEASDAKWGIPIAYLTRDAAESIGKAASKDLKQVQGEIDKDGKPRSFRVGKPARLTVSRRGMAGRGQKNIIGIWRGSDEKLRNEYVVIGAHYDHIGLGRIGTRGTPGQVHNGADDNASGTSALLEIAEALSQAKVRRSVALMWFDAEEMGLLGSEAWADRPTLPLDKVVCMINLDMIGRNEVKDIKLGIERRGGEPKYARLGALLRDAEKAFQVKFDRDFMEAEGVFEASDHAPFMKRGIPVAFFSGGLHDDFHTERDVADRINYPKEELIGRIAFWLAFKVASTDASMK